MADHKHAWRRDTTRTHKRPPRFFAVCECGAKTQAVMKFGYIHVFNTHKPSNPDLVRSVYSIRLNKAEIKSLNEGKSRIVVTDNRLRLQYKS